MKKTDKNHGQNDLFRKLLSDTKIAAGSNLKFKVMQQIATEKALSPKKGKSPIELLKNILPVFVIMYTLIASVLCVVYFAYGKSGLKSTTLLLTVIAIVSVCSIFALISAFDERRRNRCH